MTETPTATRSTRRTRRLVIVGAVALVLVAGAVVVGVTTTGSRSGTVSTVATKDDSVVLTCTRVNWGGGDNMTIQLDWTALPAGSSTPSVWERSGVSPNVTYNPNVGRNVTWWPNTTQPSRVTFWVNAANSYAGRTEVITWKPAGTSGTDTKYAEVWCPKVS